MKIHEIHEHVWDIFVLKKKKMGYIVYSKNIKRLACLSSKETSIVEREKLKIKVFGKTWTLTCKSHIKVTFFMKTRNDPTVITVTLPQPV